ncbi:hypothetical protein GUJ93_ZPchr0004g38340 [Zizania palustris]|uniref:Uncharacterized protein n=1 Tax=Zizania palustris TaxID=103762 RepID=A0A8J5S1G5_ZIZPA|nr:hypothetical protein GUJ93_ZPchr0004g38340 [Zizania palustris]
MRISGALNGLSGRLACIYNPSCQPTELLLLNWSASRASTFTIIPRTHSLLSSPPSAMSERGAPTTVVDPRFLQRQVVAVVVVRCPPARRKRMTHASSTRRQRDFGSRP